MTAKEKKPKFTMPEFIVSTSKEKAPVIFQNHSHPRGTKPLYTHIATISNSMSPGRRDELAERICDLLNEHGVEDARQTETDG